MSRACPSCKQESVFVPVEDVGLYTFYERMFGQPGLVVDGCLGRLIPNVVHCCCGHGNVQQAYCVISETIPPGQSLTRYKEGVDYHTLRGQEALDYLRGAS